MEDLFYLSLELNYDRVVSTWLRFVIYENWQQLDKDCVARLVDFEHQEQARDNDRRFNKFSETKLIPS